MKIGDGYRIVSIGIVTAAGNVEELGGVVNFTVVAERNIVFDRGISLGMGLDVLDHFVIVLADVG